MFLKVIQILEGRLEFSVLNPVDEFCHLGVQGRRNSEAGPVEADGSVDGVNFRLFPILDVLEHACFQVRVFPDSDGEDEKRQGALYGTVVVKELYGILPLDRFNLDSTGGAYVDAFLDEGEDDAA